jgi:hypothetical protein
MDSSPEQELATYESRTREIQEALQVRAKTGKRDKFIVVFALSQIDKGRKQVLFSARYAASSIFAGRDRWLAGALNVPRVAVPIQQGKGKPVDWRSSHKPGPAEVMTSFKRQWLRAGQTSQPVPGVDIGRIYSLLLDPESSEQSRWLLDRYLGLIEPLLIGLARMLSGGASLSDLARKDALTAIAVLGILLYQQGRTKETYMESRDYLLGQFLQFADLLHKLYCKHVRGGSIPPQLIGNAAIPMALQSPRRAISVLTHRMPIYLAWADRYNGDDAKWAKGELVRITSLLKSQDLNTRVGPNGKAELLLGYLASSNWNEKQEPKS